jgi:hypothetical protein
MRFAAFKSGNRERLAIASPNGELRGLVSGEEGYQDNLDLLVRQGRGQDRGNRKTAQCR